MDSILGRKENENTEHKFVYKNDLGFIISRNQNMFFFSGKRVKRRILYYLIHRDMY